MNIPRPTVRAWGRALCLSGLIVWIVSLLSRTALMSLALTPDVERFSRPLAGALRFVVTELGSLTQPVGAMLLVIIGATLLCVTRGGDSAEG